MVKQFKTNSHNRKMRTVSILAPHIALHPPRLAQLGSGHCLRTQKGTGQVAHQQGRRHLGCTRADWWLVLVVCLDLDLNPWFLLRVTWDATLQLPSPNITAQHTQKLREAVDIRWLWGLLLRKPLGDLSSEGMPHFWGEHPHNQRKFSFPQNEK